MFRTSRRVSSYRIRISDIRADANAGKVVHYDMVGRYVGEALQRPDGNGFFRLTRTHGQFVAQDMSTKTKYLVTIEENIAHTGGRHYQCR